MKRTVQELAELIGGEFRGDGGRVITDAKPFEAASASDITLAWTPKYLDRVDTTPAGCLVVPDGIELGDRCHIRVDNPYAAFARIVAVFHPLKRPPAGIHETVVRGSSVRIGADPAIGPLTAIGDDVVIGDRASVFGSVFIGDGVRIGDDVRIHPNVTVLDGTVIGNRVTIHAGTVIGSDGFGFAPEGEAYRKIHHTGIVRIGDDVEIGASNTIDRATFGETRLSSGVKTDNLVHIAHNVTVGENTILVAQVGVSGSTAIGKHAVLAGQVGVVGHIRIGDNVMVGAQSGVSKSVPDGAVVSGSPEMPHKQWLKVQSLLPRLPELRRKIAAIERRLEKLTSG